MPSADPIRQLLSDQIERLWGRGELEVVARNYAPDVVDHMPVPGQRPGLDAMGEVVALFRRAIPDMRLTLLGTAVAGDLGCDWWTLEGTQTGPLFDRIPSGRRVRFSGVDMIRARGGRVAELWHVEDMLRFEAQMAGRSEPDDDPLPLLRAASSDLRLTEMARIADGGSTAIRWRVEGTHDRATFLGLPASGKRFGGTMMEVRQAERPAMRVAEIAQIRTQLS